MVGNDTVNLGTSCPFCSASKTSLVVLPKLLCLPFFGVHRDCSLLVRLTFEVNGDQQERPEGADKVGRPRRLPC